MNDTAENARRFVDKYDWTFPVLEDPNGSEAGKLGIYGHPTVVLVDAEGGIVGGFAGAGDAAAWDELAGRV